MRIQFEMTKRWTAVLRSTILCGLGCCLVATIVGCGSSAPESGEVIDESWFSVEGSGGDEVAPDAPAEPGAASAPLMVNLKPGDRFPLQKIVEKTLTQKTLEQPIENRERIELFMSVTVEEIRDQNKKFAVRYNRVIYESILGNQASVHYDSRQPPYPVPDAALVYHGMINNGFSFWVGPDNKITDVVNFNGFLNSCLSMVPPEKAQAVSEILSKYSGQDGIANFVDDTIGLLPYDPNSSNGQTVVRLGGHWSKSRHFNDPVPMSLNNTYTLRELTDDYAKIEILGEVSPAAAVSEGGVDPVSLQIRDGHSAGVCTIDRKTGLPLESRVDHLINMTVQAEGLSFEQQKRVVTSIRMFPEQTDQQIYRLTAENEEPAPEMGQQNAAGVVQPVTHQSGANSPQIQPGIYQQPIPNNN